jgi:DNA invertase Pin-like site-specific DNA recombinase
MPASSIRVVAYLRVSTGGQEKRGLGLEGQEAAVRDFCARRGWEIVATYHDVVSGAAADEDDLTLPRPGFERLLAESNGGRGIAYVVVYATDRLWRSDLARVLVQRALKKAGLDVRSVTEPRYTLARTEPSDVFVNSVMEAVAAYERLLIASRTRRGRATKAAKGGYAGGGAPFGYAAQRGSGTLRVQEAEAEIVRLIFRLQERGLSALGIAKYLNGREYRTRAGTAWTHVQVLRVLRRRDFYAGRVYRYAGTENPASHPAILEQ